MSKVRINDLARELEVKSKQILDALEAIGLAEGKTHSSSIESGEAERVRGYFERGSRPSGAGSSRNEENRPKIDLSNISKPGDVMKAILARKQEAERQAQYPQRPASAPPAVVVRPPAGSAETTARPAVAPPPSRVVTPPPVAARPAEVRPEPRKIVPPATPGSEYHRCTATAPAGPAIERPSARWTGDCPSSGWFCSGAPCCCGCSACGRRCGQASCCACCWAVCYDDCTCCCAASGCCSAAG